MIIYLNKSAKAIDKKQNQDMDPKEKDARVKAYTAATKAKHLGINQFSELHRIILHV